MTELEAAQKFKVELNKLDRASLVDIRLEKIVHYLNKATLFLVKKKYKGEESGPGELEIMHPTLDDLAPLLKEVTVDVADGGSGSTTIPFFTDQLYFISARIKTVTEGTAGNQSAFHEGRYVKPERVYKEFDSPFNKSRADDPMITVLNKSLVIYNTDFDLDEDVIVKYLKKPNIMTGGTTDLELPFADQIIDVAVTMAIENIESERIKTQPSINVIGAD